MGWSREALLPFPPPFITKGPSHSRGGSALLKYQRGEGPPGARISGVEPEGDSSAHKSAAGHLGSPKPWFLGLGGERERRIGEGGVRDGINLGRIRGEGRGGE